MPLPLATITPSGTVNICNGDSMQFTAGGGGTYVWSSGNTTSSIYASQSGQISVVVSNSDHCSATAGPVQLNVHTTAVPLITQSGNTLTSSTGTHYQWLLNGAPLLSDTLATLAITQSGNYSVQVQDAGNCFATSAIGNYTYLTGIGSIGADLGLQVYPMPNQGTFVIECDRYKNALISIHNIFRSRDIRNKYDRQENANKWYRSRCRFLPGHGHTGQAKPNYENAGA